VADDIFEHPLLAAVYDALDPDRSDLDVYAAIVSELGAQVVLDLGCGTGTFALLLAKRGVEVVGVDPAGASLDVARDKPGASRVRWVHGDAAAVPEDLRGRVDLAVMTGNVAQAIVEERDWVKTLTVLRRCIRPGGHLVFETRRPARQGWQEWTREQSETVTNVPGHGPIRHWVQLTEVHLPLVTFESVRVFDDQTLISSSLRFRSEDEITAALATAGYDVREVRDAPYRPEQDPWSPRGDPPASQMLSSASLGCWWSQRYGDFLCTAGRQPLLAIQSANRMRAVAKAACQASGEPPGEVSA
jgi:SAM-dependent methyltransferase